jgi:Kdo2-lipid IVA lauroyltransferase/acyltransferase
MQEDGSVEKYCLQIREGKVKAEEINKRWMHRNRFRRRMEWLGIRAATFPLRHSPRPVVEAAGRGAGRLARLVLPGRIQVARTNLDLAFGDSLSKEEKEYILNKMVSNFGYWFAEFPTYENISLESLRERMSASKESEQRLEEVYSKEKGVIFLLSHFGPWELLGLCFGYLYPYPAAVVAQELHHPDIDRMVCRIRERTGNRVIYARGGAMEVVRSLRQKMCVAMVYDQALSAKRGGIETTFFGQACLTNKSVATISLRTGAPVLPLYPLPREKGRIEVRSEPILYPQPTGNHEEDVQRMTQEFNDTVEKYIRRHPECYFWLHRRWKYRPEGWPQVY